MRAHNAGREGSPAPELKSRTAKCKSCTLNVKIVWQVYMPYGKYKGCAASVKAARQMQKTSVAT